MPRRLWQAAQRSFVSASFLTNTTWSVLLIKIGCLCRGYASPEEAERWRFAAPALAGGSVIGHVYTNGGRFYCRLRQARTAAPAAQRNHSGWQ